MKKLFTFLFLGCAVVLSAADVTYDFSAQGYSNQQVIPSGVIDEQNNTVWSATGGSPAAAYYTKGNALRVYKNGAFTVSSDRVMRAITLTLGTDDKTASFDQDAVQTPNAKEFTWTYTAESGHVRVQKIEITYARDSAEVKVMFGTGGGDWNESNGYYFYIWHDAVDGKFVPAVRHGDWFSFKDEKPYNVLFNNGNYWTGYMSLQTLDIPDVNADACYVLNHGTNVEGDNDSWKLVPVSVDCALSAEREYYSVAELMQLYNHMNFANKDEHSTNKFTVRGYVTKWNSGYPTYQNADFFVDDTPEGSTTLLRAFRLNAVNAEDKHKLNEGDLVEMTAYVLNYNGQAELKEGTFKVISAAEPPVPTYTLSISADEGGSVNSEVNGTYEEGAQVTIRATEAEGWQFTKWSDQVTDNPRVLTMTRNITLQALFEQIQPPVEDDCLYPELDGKKGNELLAALHALIAEHTVLNYDNVRADKAKVDYREDGTVWDMYSDCTFNPSDYCNSSNYNTTVECECYNREHALPKSWWGGSTNEPMYTDLHHILPTDNATNQQRSAWPYGEVTETPIWSNSLGSKVGYGTFGRSGNNYVFEPADEYKGDIARIYFYMLTCYNDKAFQQGGKGYHMFIWSNGASMFTSTARDLLLKWHRADAVSDKEKKRNDAVEKKQGNRNPFVDEPELAEYIWGNKKSEAYVCGQGTPQDNPDESVEDMHSSNLPHKFLLNGQIYIRRGGKTYTVTGLEIGE